MKQPTDKDLRLYASLSDVDSDLIPDSIIPLRPAAVPTPQKTKRPSLWAVLRRPQYASVAVAALLVTMTAVALLVTGITNGPQTEPPPHGTHTTPPANPIGSVKTPTVEDASALRKGMSLSELVSLMGNDYTQEGTRYTFTLDTGEQLAVDTEYIYGGTVGSRVTGFEWLGSAGETYNPMGIPAEILQKVQNYATDTVIPVYAMSSLIGQYDSTTLPTLEDVLKDTELVYLRMAPDGKTFIVNREGLVRGSFPEGGDFSLLTEVSALFDESVKVKAYYPILTTRERGAVYFRTSIGDYILYLHGKSLEFVLEGMVGTADVVPYLIPVVEFHKFAYSVVSDQKPDYGIGWTFLDERMAVIEPYKMTAVGYQKPVSLATPEAADQVKKDMEHSAVVELLGPCLRCAAESQVYTPGHPLINFSEKAPEGLHYWELSDGSGVVLYCKRKSSIHYNGPNPPEYIASVPATDVIRISSAEIIDVLGTPTPATFALLREGLSESCVEALLGSPLEPSLWKCMEENVVHTVKLTWRASSSLALKIASIDYTTVSVTDAAREIEIGMSFAAISARLGTCVCGHESGTHSSQINDRYHCWTLPDGRSLAIYVGRNVPLPDSPFAQTSSTQFYGYSAMDILWLDPSNEDLSIGTPDRFLASHVQPGMRQEIVNSLMGQPSVTAASLASAWEWSENGKTYSLTVYWNDNRPTELYENFRTAARCELTEAPLSDISLAEKEPSAADAALITVGMSSIDMLRIMGSPSTLTLGDATLYRWCLVDGRVFCAVAEADLGDPLRGERFVTHTFYRDTFEDVSAPTAANMLEITEGMSVATVVALLGQPNYDTIPSTVGEPVYWVTPEGDWWDITVIFETVTHPDTGLKRAYVKSVSVNPPH